MTFKIKFGSRSVNEVLDEVRKLGLTIVSTDKKKVIAEAANDDQIIAFLESGL